VQPESKKPPGSVGDEVGGAVAGIGKLLIPLRKWLFQSNRLGASPQARSIPPLPHRPSSLEPAHIYEPRGGQGGAAFAVGHFAVLRP